MTQPLITVLHPTARIEPSEAFPRAWRAAYDAELANCADPSKVQYVVIVHKSRWDKFIASDLFREVWDVPSPWEHFEVVCNSDRDCVVDQVNAGWRASTGKLIIGAADDLYPPQRWDELLLASIPIETGWAGPDAPRDLDGAYVVLCASGASPERDRELMICSAITRSVLERRGYNLDPAFESMFADNHYAWENRRDAAEGKLQIIERLDIQFDHRHPIFGKGQADEIYVLQNRAKAYRDGFITFNRKANGRRVVAHLIPGETFSHRALFGYLEVNDYLYAKGFIVERYGMFSTNVYSTRLELADAVNQMGDVDFVLTSDDDNPISPQMVDMLIADLDKHPEIGIVCGWCWCDPGDYKGEQHLVMSCGRQGPALECMPFSVEDFCRMQAEGKLAITSDDIAPDAFWSGFPVVLMRGSVLKQLGWESFLPMLGKAFHRGFTSEDTTFFYRAHQAGIKSAVDLRVEVDHLKLRPLRPQILPASEREKVQEFMRATGEKLTGVPDSSRAEEEVSPLLTE